MAENRITGLVFSTFVVVGIEALRLFQSLSIVDVSDILIFVFARNQFKVHRYIFPFGRPYCLSDIGNDNKQLTSSEGRCHFWDTPLRDIPVSITLSELMYGLLSRGMFQVAFPP